MKYFSTSMYIITNRKIPHTRITKNFITPRIGALRRLFHALLEKERLGSHPERLYEHGDQQGQPVTGAVDAYLVGGVIVGMRQPPVQHDPVKGLVDHSAQSRDRQRQGIDHHVPP